jgi:YafQ family addiction module toxin component
MREFLIEETLKKDLSKLFKRDKNTYSSIMNKIEEIVCCNDVNHYKNLKRPMNEYKRVHVNTSFVLVFKYLEKENKVVFIYFDHHDKIYIDKK